MPIEAVLIKPVVDALLALFRQGNDIKLQRNASAALRDAIRELLLANPDENRAEARIAIARAAGILSEDVVLAEDMLKKTRASKARTKGKSATGRKRKPADDTSPRGTGRKNVTDKAAKPQPAKRRPARPTTPGSTPKTPDKGRSA